MDGSGLMSRSCLRLSARARGGRCPRAHARAECLRARARARRKELGLCPKRKMSGTSAKIISMK